METKTCNKCGIEKNVNEFELRSDTHKYRNTCEECRKKYLHEWYQNNINHIKEYNRINKEHIKEKSKERYQRNKEHLKEYSREFRRNHRELIQKYNLLNNENIKKRKKEYHKTHRQYENEYSKQRHAIRKMTDKKYILRIRVRNLIKHSFERQGYSKKSKTYSIIGTDYETFYNHLLQTFMNNYGYEWDGVEEVHIDHIIPLATAETEEDVIKLCHYTNLQLLKGKDNLEKGSKLDWTREG